MKSDKEIKDLIDRCMKAEENGSEYPGMTYEQGILIVLEWVFGEGEYPFEE